MVRPCVQDDKPRALASGYRPYTRTNLANCTFSTLHHGISEHLKGIIIIYQCISMFNDNE